MKPCKSWRFSFGSNLVIRLWLDLMEFFCRLYWAIDIYIFELWDCFGLLIYIWIILESYVGSPKLINSYGIINYWIEMAIIVMVKSIDILGLLIWLWIEVVWLDWWYVDLTLSRLCSIGLELLLWFVWYTYSHCAIMLDFLIILSCHITFMNCDIIMSYVVMLIKWSMISIMYMIKVNVRVLLID